MDSELVNGGGESDQEMEKKEISVSDTGKDLLTRLHRWAIERGTRSKWAEGEGRPTLYIDVKYGHGLVPTEVVASDLLVSSIVYEIDEVPEASDWQALVLGVLAKLNTRIAVPKFGADLETGEISCQICIPRLTNASDEDLFETLLSETEYGLSLWYDASVELRKRMDTGRV